MQHSTHFLHITLAWLEEDRMEQGLENGKTLLGTFTLENNMTQGWAHEWLGLGVEKEIGGGW